MSTATPGADHAIARSEIARTDTVWTPALAATGFTGHIAVEDLPTPCALLDVAVTRDNARRMQEWIDLHGAVLAPHGKTSMCPWLWDLQIDAGAWGITISHEAQLRLAVDAGVRRIMLANELLSPTGLTYANESLRRDPDLMITTWVDSLASVERMSKTLETLPEGRPLDVCVELGVEARRTGARSVAEALEVARAIAEAPRLRLVGVAGYEGVIRATPPSALAQRVRAFLDDLLLTFTEALPLFETQTPILSAGGSRFFDEVAALRPRAQAVHSGALLIIRSGAYVVSDFPADPQSTPGQRGSGPSFPPATRVLARVVSRPEPTRILLDAGRRDLPYDVALPRVLRYFRDGRWHEIGEASVFELNDQHAFVDIEAGCLVAAGDVVEVGTTHACTFFDKWRNILLVSPTDDGYDVAGTATTYF